MALKWGVVGSGKISHDFVTAVNAAYPENHKFVAVAARSKTAAEKFAFDHGIPNAYEEYLKLAQDDDVDIVYIGNINILHFVTAKMMLQHGKHILCEKPFTLNTKQTTELFKIAEKENCFIMEANWSRFFPAYLEMKRIIDSGEIGEVMFAAVNFGNSLQHIERITSLEMGGGVIIDMGIYALQFQQYVFRGLEPTRIVANGHMNEHNTDVSCGAVITYPGGKMAVVSVSARTALTNEALIVGTKGTLKMPDFWAPTKLITPTETKEWTLPEASSPYFHKNSAGLCYEAEEVRKCIVTGKRECDNMTHKETIELAKLMDYMRKEVGTKYPEDSQQF